MTAAGPAVFSPIYASPSSCHYDDFNYDSDYMSDDEADPTPPFDRDSTPLSASVSESQSVYSYSSSVDQHLILRNIHGRTFNNTNEYYMLPADPPEHSRLDLQGEMLKKKMNGLFFRPDAVRRALAPRQSGQPAVLDVGTGSGSWVIDMGKLFPHAEIVGLDLAPANLSSTPPANCRFECDDANLGLGHYKNSFDVVHARCCCSGFGSYRKYLDGVIEVLRPGGVYLSVEGDLQSYDANYQPITAEEEGQPGFTWTQKMMSAAHAAMKARGPGIEAVGRIPGWLKDMGDVWEDVGEKQFFIPVGPWEKNLDEKQTYIAELMRQDLFRLAASFRPLLISHGYFSETVDRWIAKVHNEIFVLKTPMYIRWHAAWAVKRRNPAKP